MNKVPGKGRPNVSNELVKRWFAYDPTVINSFKASSCKAVYTEEFVPWTEEKGEKTISYPAFSNAYKIYLKNNDIQFTKDNEIKVNGKLSKPRKKRFSIGYREKFEMITAYTGMIKNNYVNSLLIYGTAGVGKDYTVEQVLGKEGKYYKGGIKGVSELVKILYEDREKSIIVFSDLDSILKTLEMKNIMKTALDDKKTRYITYADDSKRAKGIPKVFEFTSSVILISNLKRFDSAYKSRSIPIEINMTNEECLDWVNYNLESFMPQIPMEYKTDVMTYLKANLNLFKNMDFRMFKHAVATRIDKPDPKIWQRWIQVILNS